MATKKTTIIRPSSGSKKTTATLKKVDAAKIGTSQKVTTPKKATSKKTTKTETLEVRVTDTPRQRIISRKYLYTVAIILALIGIFFAVSRFWVVAWVDNRPITKFELYSLLEKRDEGKTAEELIVQRLLISEGQKQRQAVTDAEIEAEIKKIEDQQGGGAQLDQILAMNKTSREDFRKLVELQLIKQKLFGRDVNITDEDVEKYIEQNKDSLPPDILNNPEGSEAAKLRESAKEQLKQIKVNENFSKWLEETMKSSRVMKI